MKIKWKQVEIECTVDEFEDMIARGWFGLKSLKEAFEEEYPDLTIPTANSQIFPHPVPIHPKQAEEDFVEEEVVCCGITHKVRKPKK